MTQVATDVHPSSVTIIRYHVSYCLSVTFDTVTDATDYLISTEARSFELDIDGETTAISAVSGSPADNGAVYTLDGRKVTNPAKKGVYIVNGKKVIIK